MTAMERINKKGGGIDGGKRLCKVCHPAIGRLYGFAEGRAKKETNAAKTRKTAAGLSLVRNASPFPSPFVSAPFLKERSQ
jgi:hypothetical protein